MKECTTCKHYQLMDRLLACNRKRKILLPAEMKELNCLEPAINAFKDFINGFMGKMEGEK